MKNQGIYNFDANILNHKDKINIVIPNEAVRCTCIFKVQSLFEEYKIRKYQIIVFKVAPLNHTTTV